MSEFKPKGAVPLGQRFTQVYRPRGDATADSPRMRRRIAAALAEYGGDFERHAEKELGIATANYPIHPWSAVLATWSLDDLLNVVTVYIVYRRDLTGQNSKMAVLKTQVDSFNRIFEQENVSYRVDSQGGVHFLHDEEFARTLHATVAGLSDPRYANSLDRFESGMNAINGATPDGKTGIRNVFEATEGLFRLMFPRAPRLTGDQVGALEPILQRRYAQDGTAAGASAKILASFKGWIDACHFYRHEPGKPDEIAQPPLELAIHLMSLGAAFIRLLIESDESKATSG